MTCRHGPDAAMQICILCAVAQLAQEQTRAEQAERDARLATHRAEAFWDVADAFSENRCSMSDQCLGHAQTDRERIEAFVARFANPHCICWLPADTDAVLDMLAEVRADEREACAQMFAASAVQRVRALERERDAALARVRELEAWVRSVATRLAGCERWDGSFEEQRFVGCDAHRSDDAGEWCIGCEAQALVEGRGSSYYAPTRQECPHREVCPDFPTCRTKDVVEPTQTARLPAGCACGGEGWCDACEIDAKRRRVGQTKRRSQ